MSEKTNEALINAGYWNANALQAGLREAIRQRDTLLQANHMLDMKAKSNELILEIMEAAHV